MPLPNPPTITIRGPFWTAQATVVSETFSGSERVVRQSRNLFVQGSDTQAGTLFALCYVRRVEIKPKGSSSYLWSRPGGAAAPASSTPAEVDAAKTSGELALLLLTKETDNEYRCIGGEICLDVLNAQGGAGDNLYQALGLSRPAELETGRWELSVHASGVSLHSLFRLPWVNGQIQAPLLLAPAISRKAEEEASGYHLSIEGERLTQAEATEMILAWQYLTRYLNPRNTLVPGATNVPVPTWVTLETANPLAVPNLYWKIEDWDAPLPRSLFAGGDALLLTLSDQQPNNEQHRPASRAAIALNEVAFTGDLTSELLLSLVTGKDTPGDTRIEYAWDNGAGGHDALKVSALDVAFSPVEVPEMLREHQGLLPPEWSPASPTYPIDPPVIWGFMPLEEGWAQLPILNLTEQIYLNAELANTAQPIAMGDRNVIQGAVSLGNAHNEVLPQHPEENPWNLTLHRAKQVIGSWKLVPVGENALQLAEVSLTIHDPDVILNGFLWLSTGYPTIEDALPTLDDWGGGLESVPLYSNHPETDLFPAPVIIQTSELNLQLRSNDVQRPSAELMAWNIEYTVQKSVFQEMILRCMLPPDVFGALPALLWMRHQTLPMIQALPLTQTQTPPNYPNASRQLVPFEMSFIEEVFNEETACAGEDDEAEEPANLLLPDGWRFGVAAGNGADQWAAVLVRDEKLQPAEEWVTEEDLPLVALSLPGLILDPYIGAEITGIGADSILKLALQMRYDLPYSDQLNALAELPKEERDPDLANPALDSEPEGQPEPLFRAQYAEYWHSLSLKASLASVAAADVFAAEDGAASVQNLVEPYRWLVQAESNLAAYPGSFTLDNANGASLPIELTAESALEGISGHFAVDGDHLLHSTNGSGNSFQLKAGSAAAYAAGENGSRKYRDQRGLLRGATRMNAENPQLLRTPISFHESIGKTNEYELVTTLGVQTLQAGGKEWQFWFRDLPASAANDTFMREATRSKFAEDINDPEAWSRQHNHLNGYEWRMGNGEDFVHLPLYNLHFYPLTLEEVAFNGETVQRVVMIGRLQLPLDKDEPAEITALSNAVKLTFAHDEAAGVPVLESVDMVSSVGEWPLQMREGETTNAPLLTWRGIAVDQANAQIVVSGAQLRYFLFDAEWILPLQNLVFASDTEQIAQTYTFAVQSDSPIAARNLLLSIDLVQCVHQATLNLDLRLGDRNSAAGAELIRRAFSTTIQVTLVDGGNNPFTPDQTMIFEDVAVDGEDLELIYTDKAFQLRWYDFARAEDTSLQMLPGMHVMHPDTSGSGLPGFAATSFHVLQRLTLPENFKPESPQAMTMLRDAFSRAEVQLPESATLSAIDEEKTRWQLVQDTHTDLLLQTPSGWVLFFGIPHLQMRMAFVELLINCAWGTYLQDGVSLDGLDMLGQREKIFGSSAGYVTLNYSTRWYDEDDTWHDEYLLNGMLEVTNLISWPEGIIPDAEDPMQLRLPAVALDEQPLPHTRHTIRVLFNQHNIPAEMLVAGDADLIFDFAPGNSWQFLAVVEHQLIDVTPNDRNFSDFTLSKDRRWTALQEVRFVSPDTFADFVRNVDTDAIDREQWVMNYGYLSEDLRDALINDGALARLKHPTLLVEASAPHWVRMQPLAANIGMTDLQYLPGGSQNAILSAPEDFFPSGVDNPHWLLLTMPFLGRLQPGERDQITIETLPPPEENYSALQIDPVLQLFARLRADVTTDDDVESDLFVNTAAIFANVSLIAEPLDIRIAVLDTASGHSWARLDQLSLQENWYRVQNPQREKSADGIRGVMAALPDTPARLSRFTALHSAFNTFRYVVVPGDEAQLPMIPDTTGQLIWRQGHLFLLQGVEAERAPDTTMNQIPYTVKSGDTLFNIGQRFETTVDAIQDANPDDNLDVIHPGDVIQIPLPFAVRSQPYIVRRGDTVSELAVRFSSRRDQWDDWMDAFVLANQIEDRNLIITRQVVWIPILGGGTSSGGDGDIAPFQLCWIGDQGNSSSWNIYNPHPVPLSSNPQRKVRFNWYALDEQGRILQQGKRWENGGITRHNTVKAASLKVEWYIVTDNQEGEIIGTTVIEAREDFRCDDDWPRQQPPIPEKLSPLRHPYAWHLIAPQIHDWPTIDSVVQRYPAATLLPVPRDQASDVNEYPVSFCISPYVGVDFAQANVVEPRLIFAELLCLDPATQEFTTVASQLYDLEAIFIQAGENLDSADFGKQAQEIYTTESVGWAREIQRRLAPDTPIAVLRFRTINKAKQPQPGEAALTTTYAFSLVNDLKVQERLSRRVFSIRTEPGELRYRQGHFGGYQMPQDVKPFEAAPPQTTGVQPIYFTEQPDGQIDPDVREANWPWGVSALRMSVQYTDGKRGVVGSTGENGDEAPTTLWWQAPQHQVQFRTQTEDERPTGGLPKNFRAPAIRSMLPVLPDAPLPTVDADAEFSTEITDETFMEKWQPVLPGNLRYLLLGNRAGAMFAFRNMLLRQSNLSGNSTGDGLVSGSVPVQHRVPRPVPLPPNVLPEYALQTWASRFEPQRNSLVTESPADEAFFADVPMRRMKITLSTPLNGVVMPGWTGEVVLDIVSEMGEDWIPEPATIADYLDLQLIQGNQQPRLYGKTPQDLSLLNVPADLEASLPAEDVSDPQNVVPVWRNQFENAGVRIAEDATVQRIDPVGGVATWRLYDEDSNPYLIAKIGGGLRAFREEDRFKVRFSLTGLTDEEKRTGIVSEGTSDTLRLQALVYYEKNNPDNFKQVLSLPLRVGDSNRLPLPLVPRFVHFEDPEYNRRLASAAATASRNVDVYDTSVNPFEKDLYTVTLAADRKEYNPDSELAFRYDWLGGIPFAPGDADQPDAVVLFVRVTEEGAQIPLAVKRVETGDLKQIKLGEFGRDDDSQRLRPGDVLELYLYVGGDVDSLRVVDSLPGGEFPQEAYQLESSAYDGFLAKAILLRVNIIEEAVIPVPEAGYALLHAQQVEGQMQVECGRFAWNPAAARVELISPDDLLVETVRRRAIFHWTHTIRPGRGSAIAIQKITNTGSTHFPLFGVDDE